MESPFRTLKHSTRWFLLSATLATAFFMGAAVRTVGVGAQTFTEPTCNPLTEGPDACNAEKPVLQSANVLEQTIQSVLNLAGVVYAQNKIVLQGANSQIITSGALAGPLINLAQEYSFNAIAASATDQPAIYGKATNNSGVYAVSDTAYALTAHGNAGQAALLEGVVDIKDNGATLNVVGPTNLTGALTVTGNANITGTLTVGGQTLGVGTSEENTAYVTKAFSPAATHTFTFKPGTTTPSDFGWPTLYPVSSVQVFYARVIAGTIISNAWQPLDEARITYQECLNPTTTTGVLQLDSVNDTYSYIYRVIVTYRAQPVVCNDLPPTLAVVSSRGNNFDDSQDTTLTANITENGTVPPSVTSVTYYAYKDGDTTHTNLGTATVAPWSSLLWNPSAGTYRVYAKASDSLNTVVSPVLTIVVGASATPACGGCTPGYTCCTSLTPDQCIQDSQYFTLCLPPGGS